MFTISVTPKNSTIYAPPATPSSIKLSALVIFDDGATSSVATWSSSDTARVTVDGTGLARAVAGATPGTATIRAVSGAATGSATVEVKTRGSITIIVD